MLAYHGIGQVSGALDPEHLMVAPDRFRRQLDALCGRGYRFLKITRFRGRDRELFFKNGLLHRVDLD